MPALNTRDILVGSRKVKQFMLALTYQEVKEKMRALNNRDILVGRTGFKKWKVICYFFVFFSQLQITLAKWFAITNHYSQFIRILAPYTKNLSEKGEILTKKGVRTKKKVFWRIHLKSDSQFLVPKKIWRIILAKLFAIILKVIRIWRCNTTYFQPCWYVLVKWSNTCLHLLSKRRIKFLHSILEIYW